MIDKLFYNLFSNTCNSFLKIQSETYSWGSEKRKRYLKFFLNYDFKYFLTEQKVDSSVFYLQLQKQP